MQFATYIISNAIAVFIIFKLRYYLNDDLLVGILFTIASTAVNSSAKSIINYLKTNKYSSKEAMAGVITSFILVVLSGGLFSYLEIVFSGLPDISPIIPLNTKYDILRFILNKTLIENILLITVLAFFMSVVVGLLPGIKKLSISLSPSLYALYFALNWLLLNNVMAVSIFPGFECYKLLFAEQSFKEIIISLAVAVFIHYSVAYLGFIVGESFREKKLPTKVWKLIVVTSVPMLWLFLLFVLSNILYALNNRVIPAFNLHGSAYLTLDCKKIDQVEIGNLPEIVSSHIEFRFVKLLPNVQHEIVVEIYGTNGLIEREKTNFIARAGSFSVKIYLKDLKSYINKAVYIKATIDQFSLFHMLGVLSVDPESDPCLMSEVKFPGFFVRN